MKRRNFIISALVVGTGLPVAYYLEKHNGSSNVLNRPDQLSRFCNEVELKDIKKACNYMATVYELSPLRHSENIYARTPEDTDPLFNKTRARQSPTAESELPTSHLIHNSSLEGSSMSISGSDEGRRDRDAQKSTKRAREGSAQSEKSHLGRRSSNDTLAPSHEAMGRNDDIPWGGQTPDEPERKRQKTAVSKTAGFKKNPVWPKRPNGFPKRLIVYS